MNLLILSRYDRLGASSRLRFMQYVPALEQAGIAVSVESFFDNGYLEDLYSGRRSIGRIPRAYRQRLASLQRKRDIDVIWLEKEAFPWMPASLELSFLPKGVPVVADYDDAVFHRYDQHPRRLVRALLGNKIGRVMKNTQMVMAGNRYLGHYASKAGAHHVEIVPTVVDVDKYDARPRDAFRKTVTVGWMGTPGTWQECVRPFLPLIQASLAEHSTRFLVVGAGNMVPNMPPLEIRAWSESREAYDIRDMDIGIMPLPDTPWMRGKCGYKLIQYMACGLPVVASPIGVNTEIVEHGVNGFLAETDEEWRRALETLIESPDLRQRMGRAGRRKVEERYSLQVQGPRVAGILTELVRQRQMRP